MCSFFCFLGSIVLFALMLLTTADVIGRYLFNKPILGVLELTQFMMVCLVFLGMIYTQAENGHISVDILASRCSSKIRTILFLFNNALSFSILLLISLKSFTYAMEIRMAQEISTTLGIPVYPFILIPVIGCLAVIMVIISNSIEAVRRLK